MYSNGIKTEKAGEEMVHKLKTIRADMLVLQCQLQVSEATAYLNKVPLLRFLHLLL